MLSVIIPTLNEEENLKSLIPYLQACPRSNEIEIIVVDSALSIDNGFKIAQSHNIRVCKSERSGRANQMNLGAKKAKGKYLYFLHADTRPPRDFISDILSAFQKGYQFGCFSYKFDSSIRLLKINSCFTRFGVFLTGGGDQSLFIERKEFEALNGFNEDCHLMEDFEFFHRARKNKLSFHLIKNDLLVSDRKYAKNSWLKVNWINFRIYFLFWLGMDQKVLIKISEKLN